MIINKVLGAKLSAVPTFFIFPHFLLFSHQPNSNSEDERLNPFFPRSRGLLGKGSVVKLRVLMFSTQVFTAIHVSPFNYRFKSLRCTLNDLYLVIF